MNLFYQEPDNDRWFPFDRYPRKIIRRILRGRPVQGGHALVFRNLCKGLDLLGVRYSVNNYSFIKRNPEMLACIIGKPFVLDKIAWKNPILFGAAVYSHPCDNPHLLERLDIRKILVPCEWMRLMCSPYWGDKVSAWPVGIDTEMWAASTESSKNTDVLIYDKVRWEHSYYESSLIEPIRKLLKDQGISYSEIRYGYYKEENFRELLSRCKSMIFLCEHETQGLAYQQALSCGVPVLAWDRGGPWQDPAYYPEKVIFEPVTSVPYWDERCGMRFSCIEEFSDALNIFWMGVSSNRFKPREFILDNLTLEICAKQYHAVFNEIASQSVR